MRRANKRKASEKAEKEIIAKVERSKVAMKGASENKLTRTFVQSVRGGVRDKEYAHRN